jgi:hypothetical protein
VLVVEQVHVERCKQRRSEVDSSSLPPYPRTLKWTSVHFCGVDGFITIRVSPWAQFEEQTVMYRWFNDYGYEADIAALREEHGLSSSSISTSVPTAGRLLKLLQ